MPLSLLWVSLHPPRCVCPAAGKHPETSPSPWPQRRRFPPRNSEEVPPQSISLSNRSSVSRSIVEEVDWTNSTVEFLKCQVWLSHHLNLSVPTDEQGGEARQLFTVTSAGGGKWGKQTEKKQKKKKKFQLLLLPGSLCLCQSSIDFFFLPSWFQRQLGILLWGGAPSFTRRACVLLRVSTDGCHCMSAGLHIHVMEAEEARRHAKWTAGLADWN